MPNNISNVSFANPAYDYAGELSDIERQRKLADALRAQSLAPGHGTQMAGNIAIRNSPWEGIAKIAQGASAEYVSQQAKEKQAGLAKRSQTDLSNTLAEAMKAYQGTPARDAVAVPADDLGGGPGRDAQSAVVGDPMRAAEVMMRNPQTAPMAGPMMTKEMDRMGTQRLIEGLRAQSGGGTGGTSGGAAPTGAAAFMSWMTPDIAMRMIGSGDANAKAMGEAFLSATKGIAQRPGAPVIEGMTGRVIAQPPPAMIPGVQLNMGPQGNTASPVPGYTAAQDTLGNTPMQEVKNADGTTSYIPKTQLIQGARANPLAGNTAPPGASIPSPVGTVIPQNTQPTPPPAAGVPGGMNIPPQVQSARDGDRLSILRTELASQQAAGRVDPNLLQEIAQAEKQRPQGGIPRFGQDQEGQIKQEATKRSVIGADEDFQKNVWRPAMDAAQTARRNNAEITALSSNPIATQTGWGTGQKAWAANVLSGLVPGITPDRIKEYASNAQTFQAFVMERNRVLLNEAKGVQTEGDSKRIQETFAQLKNTPAANAMLLDYSKAVNNAAIKRGDFFSANQERAIQGGSLRGLESDWYKNAPSIWDDPIMQKWKPDQKGIAPPELSPLTRRYLDAVRGR